MVSCLNYCGDGIRVGYELEPGHCDDGNEIVRDGCTNCSIDHLYECSGSPSVCSSTCGNGIL